MLKILNKNNKHFNNWNKIKKGLKHYNAALCIMYLIISVDFWKFTLAPYL